MTAGALTAVVTLAATAVIYTGAFIAVSIRPGPFARAAGPMLAALAGAIAIVLPAFVFFEPPHAGETLGWVLPALAVPGALLIGRWTGRALRMLTASARLTRVWTRGGVRLPDARWGPNATAIDTGFPIVAVAGIVRPRLFVDRRVLEACTCAELDAIAAHERAHVERADNLRRLLVGACSGASSAAAAAWRTAAEFTADARAADSPGTALNLAEALLKIARLGTNCSLDAVLVSTIHDAAPLATRVHRLLTIESARTLPSRRGKVAWLAALPAVPAAPLLLRTVHSCVEQLVRHLP